MTCISYRINNKLEYFSIAEKKVGNYILANKDSVIKMNTAELAMAAKVSTATVTRFSKKLIPQGGFPELKLQLSAEGIVDSNIYKEINPNDDLKSLKSKLTLRINQTINETSLLVNNDALSKSCNIINIKSTIYVYGLGASDVVASDFEQKFIRIGKSIIHSQDTNLIAVGMANQAENSVLVLISNSGEKIDSIKLAKTARSIGVPVIVLTHNAVSTLAKLATVILINDSSEEDLNMRAAATTSLVAQLYIIDLLYYTFINNDYNKHVKQLITSREIIKKHFN